MALDIPCPTTHSLIDRDTFGTRRAALSTLDLWTTKPLQRQPRRLCQPYRDESDHYEPTSFLPTSASLKEPGGLRSRARDMTNYSTFFDGNETGSEAGAMARYVSAFVAAPPLDPVAAPGRCSVGLNLCPHSYRNHSHCLPWTLQV